jgi:endonuclease YncB( thermonuclease family)
MATTQVFKTIVNAVYVYEGESQELAIRAWDSESVHRADLHGGVMVQEFDAGEVMVRDGWILHVNEDGHVYLNPRV